MDTKANTGISTVALERLDADERAKFNLGRQFDFASADMDSSKHAEQISIAIAILCLIRENFARDSATVSEPTASKDLRPPCRQNRLVMNEFRRISP